ncbi:hypothetical protein CQ13_34050 [Bradyrhizobium retamae]|uniref:Uncharacterized protein n=1 Tax=Bradyrhizobium retamae TaxID=1300035 RepID=A0A0R3MQD6_9BRAD|nr:hypothetical protein CQ13_34050 [Bradyrhizobium retamae]
MPCDANRAARLPDLPARLPGLSPVGAELRSEASASGHFRRHAVRATLARLEPLLPPRFALLCGFPKQPLPPLRALLSP